MSRLAFYSLIPGLALLTAGISVYYVGFDDKFSISGALKIYADLLGSDGEFQESTCDFLDQQLNIFVCFNLIIYLTAAFLGVSFHYIIQKMDLDKKMKIFRFKNYWYYVFSGEILKFKKFIKASIDVEINAMSENSRAIVTYADILCNESGQSKLYRGYVVDYELDSENINHLDKVYLLNAARYDRNSSRGLIEKNELVKKSIKGDLLVLDSKNVINLNLTYVPSLKQLSEVHRSKDRSFRWLALSFLGFRWICLLLMFDLIWINLIFSNTLIYFLSLDTSIYKILFSLLSLTVFGAIFGTIDIVLFNSFSKRKEEYLKVTNPKLSNVDSAILKLLKLDKKVSIRSKLGVQRKKLKESRKSALKAMIAYAVFIILLKFIEYLFG